MSAKWVCELDKLEEKHVHNHGMHSRNKTALACLASTFGQQEEMYNRSWYVILPYESKEGYSKQRPGNNINSHHYSAATTSC